jgi:hypothetical protein
VAEPATEADSQPCNPAGKQTKHWTSRRATYLTNHTGHTLARTPILWACAWAWRRPARLPGTAGRLTQHPGRLLSPCAPPPPPQEVPAGCRGTNVRCTAGCRRRLLSGRHIPRNCSSAAPWQKREAACTTTSGPAAAPANPARAAPPPAPAAPSCPCRPRGRPPRVLRWSAPRRASSSLSSLTRVLPPRPLRPPRRALRPIRGSQGVIPFPHS